jgi:hypothetical protein
VASEKAEGIRPPEGVSRRGVTMVAILHDARLEERAAEGRGDRLFRL